MKTTYEVQRGERFGQPYVTVSSFECEHGTQRDAYHEWMLDPDNFAKVCFGGPYVSVRLVECPPVDNTPITPVKSRGHVTFAGPLELVRGDDGCLYVGQSNTPLDIDGYRMGLRWECYPHQFEYWVSHYRALYE